MKLTVPEVVYKYHSGSDIDVVNAARVSFHKEVDTFTEKDERLIKYLATHNHWTPFSHNSITLYFKAPIFVARQLGKHQVGFTWSEVSRRYVDEEPEFYFPEIWRSRAENVKQGSSEDRCEAMYTPRTWVNTEDTDITPVDEVFMSMADTVCTYNILINIGVAPEQARMILPQNMMTEWYWTGSLAAYARMANLRLDSHAQKECTEIATMVSNIIEPLFPVSWKALVNETPRTT